jgi:O-antigen ligase
MNEKIHSTAIFFFFLIIYFSTKMLWDTAVPSLFELFSVIILVLGAILFFLNYDYQRSNTFLLLLFLFFSFYVLVNGIIQDKSSQLIRAIYEYIFYGLIFWSCLFFLKKVKIGKIIPVFAYIGIFISLLSWVEFLSGQYLIRPISLSYIGFRSVVFSRSYLSHGVILGIFSLSNLYCFFQKKKGRYLLFSIFCFLSILTTQSRGPFISCLVSLIAIWFISFRVFRISNPARKRILLGFFLTLSLGVLLIFAFINSSNTIVQKFLLRLGSVFNWQGDSGNQGRIQIWNDMFQMWAEHLWFGIGPSKTGSWGIDSIGVTESGILKVLVELGIVGGLLFFSFSLAPVFLLIKREKYLSQTQKVDSLLFIGIFLCIFIDNITLQVTEEIMVSFFYWFSLAGLYHLSMSCRANKAEPSRKGFSMINGACKKKYENQ